MSLMKKNEEVTIALISEKSELDLKIVKLSFLLKSDINATKEYVAIMEKQLDSMKTYSQCLQDRISQKLM